MHPPLPPSPLHNQYSPVPDVECAQDHQAENEIGRIQQRQKIHCVFNLVHPPEVNS